MANKVVSLIILIVGISMGLGIGFHLFTEAGWAVFFIAVLLAFLNYKKNPFKLQHNYLHLTKPSRNRGLFIYGSRIENYFYGDGDPYRDFY